jgi:hypothetical protein
MTGVFTAMTGIFLCQSDMMTGNNFAYRYILLINTGKLRHPNSFEFRFARFPETMGALDYQSAQLSVGGSLRAYNSSTFRSTVGVPFECTQYLQLRHPISFDVSQDLPFINVFRLTCLKARVSVTQTLVISTCKAAIIIKRVRNYECVEFVCNMALYRYFAKRSGGDDSESLGPTESKKTKVTDSQSVCEGLVAGHSDSQTKDGDSTADQRHFVADWRTGRLSYTVADSDSTDTKSVNRHFD